MKKTRIMLVVFLLNTVLTADLCLTLATGKNEVLSINIKYVPGSIHQTSRNLCTKPLCEMANTEFYVTLNPYFWPAKAFSSRGKNNCIYFAPHVLASKHFKAIAAYELGHIVKNTNDQYEADKFAAQLVGNRQKVIDALIGVANLKHNDPRITMLSK